MADLTPEGLERIETIARAACDGDHWECVPGEVCDEAYAGEAFLNCGGGEGSVHFTNKALAEHIASAQPLTVLALVSRVRELEKYERYWTNHEQSLAAMKASCVDKCHCPPQYVCEYEDGTRHCLHCEAAKWWATEGQLEAVSNVAENLNKRVLNQSEALQPVLDEAAAVLGDLSRDKCSWTKAELIALREKVLAARFALDGAKGGNQPSASSQPSSSRE